MIIPNHSLKNFGSAHGLPNFRPVVVQNLLIFQLHGYCHLFFSYVSQEIYHQSVVTTLFPQPRGRFLRGFPGDLAEKSTSASYPRVCHGFSIFSYMRVSIVMGVPQNGWFIMRNPTKMDDLPPVILHVRWTFSTINHPAMGYLHEYVNPLNKFPRNPYYVYVYIYI